MTSRLGTALEVFTNWVVAIACTGAMLISPRHMWSNVAAGCLAALIVPLMVREYRRKRARAKEDAAALDAIRRLHQG